MDLTELDRQMNQNIFNSKRSNNRPEHQNWSMMQWKKVAWSTKMNHVLKVHCVILQLGNVPLGTLCLSKLGTLLHDNSIPQFPITTAECTLSLLLQLGSKTVTKTGRQLPYKTKKIFEKNCVATNIDLFYLKFFKKHQKSALNNQAKPKTMLLVLLEEGSSCQSVRNEGGLLQLSH